MNLGSVTMLGKADGLASTRINTIVEHEEKMYIGCDDGAIFIKDGANITPINLVIQENEIGIRDFVIDDEGTVWVASYMGLLKFKNNNQKLITTKEGLSSNLVRKILRTKDKKLWLATKSGGVIRYGGENNIQIFNVDNHLKSNYILALEEDNYGNVVVGTHSGGLSIIGSDTIVTHFIPDISGALIFNIHVDQKNRYWLSTNTGIFVFDMGGFRKIEFNTEFKVETIFDFVPDIVGNVWLTTNIGIGRVVFNDLNGFLEGSIERVDVELFDNYDGMTTKECTGATRSLLTSKGEVWIPTIDGIAIINNDRLQKNLQVPEIIITSLIVDNDQMPSATHKIESGKVRYEIEYASTSYLVPEKVRFRYKLSGVDRDWIVTSKRSVEYTNLAPGAYTFSVVGSNGNNVWNEEGDQISFIVEPFYYQTWWFYLL
ncbi:MAG: triple tyrosine motif-containing protein, partial [Bacteroidota bacterium]